jgi:predicted DsbA family dithiol-disulfide isomerase
MTNSPAPELADGKTERVSVVVVSDFVCPWCYIGSQALKRLEQEYPVDISWAPFLLDPTVPPEGRATEPRTKPGDPLTRVEERAVEEGLNFARGRTFRPNSHLALEAAMYAQEQAESSSAAYQHALYRAHFETLENIGDLETLVRIGIECGLDGNELRDALETRRYRAAVDEDIQVVQELGVSAVPTFIFNNEYAIVGAEKYPAFQRMMEKLGYPPPPGAEPPPDTYRLAFNEPTAAPTGED